MDFLCIRCPHLLFGPRRADLPACCVRRQSSASSCSSAWSRSPGLPRSDRTARHGGARAWSATHPPMSCPTTGREGASRGAGRYCHQPQELRWCGVDVVLLGDGNPAFPCGGVPALCLCAAGRGRRLCYHGLPALLAVLGRPWKSTTRRTHCGSVTGPERDSSTAPSTVPRWVNNCALGPAPAGPP